VSAVRLVASLVAGRNDHLPSLLDRWHSLLHRLQASHLVPNSRCLLCADIVAKVFLGWRTKILRAADTLYARQREGPHRFIQNRSRTSAVALKSDAAAEKSKDQLSRDFPGRSIFDFCNNIRGLETRLQGARVPDDIRRAIPSPPPPSELPVPIQFMAKSRNAANFENHSWAEVSNGPRRLRLIAATRCRRGGAYWEVASQSAA
jgi:hypothetical protein